jgi:hypothetical protein
MTASTNGSNTTATNLADLEDYALEQSQQWLAHWENSATDTDGLLAAIGYGVLALAAGRRIDRNHR